MLIDSKSKGRKQSSAEEQLSQIPTMVTEISRKIADYRKSYGNLVKNAEAFFREYPQDYKKLTTLKHKVQTYQNQIEHIEAFRKEKGRYPSIKGHTSGQRYLAKLVAQQDNSEKELADLENRLRTESNNRYEHVDHLTDHLLDLLNGERIFNQFMGTIVLSAPTPEEKVRQLRNEKNKPIYVTALTIALFEQIRTTQTFSSKFLEDELQKVFGKDRQYSLMVEKTNLDDIVQEEVTEAEDSKNVLKPMSAEMKMAYRENVLKPLAKAALLQSIGSYSPEAQQLLGEDRYRKLDAKDREKLLSIIDNKTHIYLKVAIGIPTIRFRSREHREQFLSREKKQLGFILKALSALKKTGDDLGDLIRIPMTYASFLLSTKNESEYTHIYNAYKILEQGKASQAYKGEYIDAFLKMVGRFPLGSGIYVIQESSGEIERAIVSSMYPDNPDEPICKIITRRQIQFLSQAEAIISKSSNLFFKATQLDCHYDAEYLDQRYRNTFTWNANEVWEVQLPAIEFWKKDGTRRYNGRFKPESY